MIEVKELRSVRRAPLSTGALGVRVTPMFLFDTPL